MCPIIEGKRAFPQLCRIKVFALALVTLLGAPGFIPLLNSAGSAGEALMGLRQQLFQYVNLERRARRLPELNWDDALAQEAERHAGRLAQGRFLSHRDPLRGSISERLDSVGIPWRQCAENLYEGNDADPARDALQTWMGSSGHRRNLMNAQWSDTGVGVAQRSDGRILIVQEYILR